MRRPLIEGLVDAFVIVVINLEQYSLLTLLLISSKLKS